MSFCKESPTLGVRRFFHLQNFGTKVLTKSHCVKGQMWIKIRKKSKIIKGGGIISEAVINQGWRNFPNYFNFSSFEVGNHLYR